MKLLGFQRCAGTGAHALGHLTTVAFLILSDRIAEASRSFFSVTQFRVGGRSRGAGPLRSRDQLPIRLHAGITSKVPRSKLPTTPFEQSRLAADATREVNGAVVA